MFFLWHELEGRLNSTISHGLRQDLHGIEVMSGLFQLADDQDPGPSQEAKRRKVAYSTSSKPKATVAGVAESLGLSPDVVDFEDTDRTMYREFSEDLASGSFLMWRHHSENLDVVVMNDYCSSTGKILPQAFVHVTAQKWEGGQLNVSCSCRTYSILQESENTTEAMDPLCTCMHCRFFLEHLQNVDPGQLGDPDEVPHYLQCIQDNLDKVGNPVVCLGTCGNTTKFSVFGQDHQYTLVHLTLHLKDCWARCLSGNCQIKYLLNKKKFPKEPLQLNMSEKLCPHLNTLWTNMEVVHEEMDFFFHSESPVFGGEEDAEDLVPEKDVPTPNVFFKCCHRFMGREEFHSAILPRHV